MPDTHERFVRCRTLGHSWFDVATEWDIPKIYGLPLTVRCERCGMERRDAVSQSTGELTFRRYVVPEGYKYSRDDPAPSRSQFRLMLLALRNRNEQVAANNRAAQSRATSRAKAAKAS